MATIDRTSALAAIEEKVLAGARLDLDDGVALLESDDILAVGRLADTARRLRGGTDEVFFVNNLYLNHTNICRVKCKFCAFARTGKQEGAYVHDIGDLVQHALEVYETQEFNEIHMVGGEHPGLEFSYYVDLIRSLKEALPDVHLKCFTASEIHHMTTISGLDHATILRELRAVGLGSLPGGGAEVFSHRVRQIVAPGKESPEQWLETHRLAHGMGMPTHCTMLYNHVENYEERIDHLLRLRELQDETGGFLAFIPLPFHPENTVFERRGWAHTTGHDDLKMQAVSRLMLDNIPNIKAYWIMISTPLAQVALHFGANDIQGTVVEETIAHAGGATTPTEEKIADLVRVISEAGRIPVQRDTHYNVLRRFDGQTAHS
jgi:aminodeoxyfutalosine synthase